MTVIAAMTNALAALEAMGYTAGDREHDDLSSAIEYLSVNSPGAAGIGWVSTHERVDGLRPGRPKGEK